MLTNARVYCIFYIFTCISVRLNCKCLFFYLLINEWGFILQASDIVNEDTELLVKLTTAYRHNAKSRQILQFSWDVTSCSWADRQQMIRRVFGYIGTYFS